MLVRIRGKRSNTMLRGTLSSQGDGVRRVFGDRDQRGINRTKTFYVKRFGTIWTMNLTSPHSSRGVNWCDRAVSKSRAAKLGQAAPADRGAPPGRRREQRQINRTKVFHVKRFGTIGAMNLTSPHSSRGVNWCDRAVSKSRAAMDRRPAFNRQRRLERYYYHRQ